MELSDFKKTYKISDDWTIGLRPYDKWSNEPLVTFIRKGRQITPGTYTVDTILHGYPREEGYQEYPFGLCIYGHIWSASAEEMEKVVEILKDVENGTITLD